MFPKRRRKRNLPVPLREGTVLKDTEKREWRLGRKIAEGGFGLIYLASPRLDIVVEDSAAHVIKVEYLENGPLFSELKFYQRAAKQEQIRKWMALKQVAFLGVPVFWGAGQAEHNGKSYRFMVMERLGEDLQTIFEREGRRFKKEKVLQIGARMLDILEYIHENEYVHGDIKAANILLGYRNPHEVYLADYGLAYRYCPNGSHKAYRENPKKGHNGTIEFTSLDAHMGVAPSRRGDLQILGFCMLQWILGKLPWETLHLKNLEAVLTAKRKLLDQLPDSVTRQTPEGTDCGEVAQFLETVRDLRYDEEPNYKDLKQILLSGLEHSGIRYNDPLDFTAAQSSRNECFSHDYKVDLAKPTPMHVKEVTERKLGSKTSAYQRRVRVGTKGSYEQDKPLQTEAEAKEQVYPSYLCNTCKKLEEKENSVICQPECASSPGSSIVSRASRSVLWEELYRYLGTIIVLLLLILFSLVFL